MDLNRRNFLTGTGLVAAGSLMGTSSAMAAYNQAAPASPNPLSNGNLLHDSKFATEGFKRYKNLHPAGLVIGRDIGIVNNPAGVGSPVAYFDSSAGLTHGNAYPRASVEAPARAYATAHGNTKSIYLHYSRLYIPKSSAMSEASQWSAFMGVHGAPWIGASRTGLMLLFNPKTGNHYLRMGDDPSLLKESDTIVPLDKWVGFLVAFNYNYAKNGGWIQFFMNTTGSTRSGWRRVPVKGKIGKVSEDVISSEEGEGWFLDKNTPAATPRVGTYGSHPMKLYVSEHRFGRTVRSVLGRNWNGLFDGKKMIL